MPHDFNQIITAYQGGYEQYGDSYQALLWGKARQEIRFHVLAELLRNAHDYSVCDYGCGLAHLLPYLRAAGWSGHYHGLDIAPFFIEHNISLNHANASFELIDAEEKVGGVFDVVFASGVFNMRSHSEDSACKAYVFQRLENLYACSAQFLVCDFLSSYVDFVQPASVHFSPTELMDMVVSRLTRRFIVRHDVLPYEFSVICYKDAAIERPSNAYLQDSLSAVHKR